LATHIGIIGSSGHYHYALAGEREIEDAVICAVAPGSADEDMSRLTAALSAASVSPKQYDDYREMLDREDLNVVAVNPQFHLNSEVTTEALSRAIPVLCEKPLAIDLESLDRVRQAQLQSKAGLGMMLALRYDARFYTARQLVASGAIGEPALGYSQKSYKLGTRPPFYCTRETFGGLIPWIGIHAIDWFRWISGIEYTAVIGHHANVHAPQYGEMEDTAACLFELANGGSAVMSFDYLRPAGAETHGDDRLRLIGSAGCLDISGAGLTLTDPDGTRSIDPVSPPHGLLADFAMSLADKDHRCLISTEDALRVTEISLLAREAADNGCRVLLSQTGGR